MKNARRLCMCVGLAAAISSPMMAASLARADIVTDWNNHWIESVRAVGGKPGPISRAAAMVHTAIYEAVIAIDQTHESYYGSYLPAPQGASREAAAAAAGHRVLVHLYPTREAIFDAALADMLAQIPDGQAEDDGVALGVAAGDAVIADRTGDGSEDEFPYVPGTSPGDWRPTFPDFTQQPYTPHWGTVRTWTMTTGDQFRPDTPLGFDTMDQLLRSRQYAQSVNQTKLWGEINSPVRTQEQTDIAFFWANDFNGTWKPPGHLNHITQVVSADRNLSLSENARLFALVNIAMADAGIAAWDCKFETEFDLWRPQTAIREADTDGNRWTQPDPDWLPLLGVSPPFPAYVSGHATFGAAHAEAMASFFGTDKVTYTILTDDPAYTGGARTYHSFSDAAWENAVSRVYLGVHYLFDGVEGNRLGTRVGRYVAQTQLRPVGGDCVADLNGDGQVNGRDLSNFVSAYLRQHELADINDDGVIDAADVQAFLQAYVQGC